MCKMYFVLNLKSTFFTWFYTFVNVPLVSKHLDLQHGFLELTSASSMIPMETQRQAQLWPCLASWFPAGPRLSKADLQPQRAH